MAMLAAPEPGTGSAARHGKKSPHVTLFLAGDVMTGRGIDQVLPHPGDPQLHETFMKSALGYVELAEDVNGPIPRPVPFSYIWGDALAVLERVAPDARIINLETAVTTSGDHLRGKGIHYRMHPRNAPVLSAARLDVCSLANNHVLDWGYAGLLETLATLRAAGIRTTGAGRDLAEAERPAVVDLPGGTRVLVFAHGSPSSGIPPEWAATSHRAGVNLLHDFSDASVDRIAAAVRRVKRPGDIAVASIHWGANWGYAVPPEHVSFAHRLIDRAGIDVVHGHSSHHPKGMEVHAGKLVIYGAGDLINDYEGIGGYEAYRGDLSILYFARVDTASGRLLELRMVPMRMVRMRLEHASSKDAAWLRATLDRESRRFGTRVETAPDGELALRGD